MGLPKKPTPEEEKMLAERGLSIMDLARESDRFARSEARKNYGPYEDTDEPDAYDLMMNSPSIMDFEPCTPTCDATCPCRYKPPDEDA